LAKRASLASCSAVSSLLRPTPTPRHRPSTSSALRPSRRAVCRHHNAQDSGVSQFRYTKCLHMQRVYDHVGYPRGLPWRPLGCCLPLRLTASAAGSSVFRGSIPRLWFPLSTLRNGPHGPSRMTRGQYDWLGLCCTTLSFATLCSFVLAHLSVSPVHVGANFEVGGWRSEGCGRSPVAGAAAGGAGALELVGWATSAGAQPDGWSQGRNLRGGAVGQAWEDVSCTSDYRTLELDPS
jgi:hypothetical protein